MNEDLWEQGLPAMAHSRSPSRASYAPTDHPPHQQALLPQIIPAHHQAVLESSSKAQKFSGMFISKNKRKSSAYEQ
ncbi:MULTISPECIES: hypothetical protein [Pseudomonas]|uniref:hypothetical protein n=1 Tax=Pseudomonas TaxID=286 RepID=UPI000B19393E|nr:MULTISPECIES: hypothetical protein [Pseudomonas]